MRSRKTLTPQYTFVSDSMMLVLSGSQRFRTAYARCRHHEFELSPIDAFLSDAPGDGNTIGTDDDLAHDSLTELSQKALADSAEARTPSERKANWRKRSRAIRRYVLKRAGDKCEGCEAPAPFKTAKGQPYLEPHHIRRLTDGGPDHPHWVIGVCPNCHQRAYHSADAVEFNQTLVGIVEKIEGAIA
jgi:5-methylcytosine-specific restriction protein A